MEAVKDEMLKELHLALCFRRHFNEISRQNINFEGFPWQRVEKAICSRILGSIFSEKPRKEAAIRSDNYCNSSSEQQWKSEITWDHDFVYQAPIKYTVTLYLSKTIINVNDT